LAEQHAVNRWPAAAERGRRGREDKNLSHFIAPMLRAAEKKRGR
jgi:hypothetical protein